MKKFVNDPLKYVPDMLKGIALANPDTLRYVPEYNLIMRADAPRDDKVSIVQGSGSGHEPAHVLTVGKGMLDGACPGDVFAAPPMDYVYETTKLLASPKGVLLLVNAAMVSMLPAIARPETESRDDEPYAVPAPPAWRNRGFVVLSACNTGSGAGAGSLAGGGSGSGEPLRCISSMGGVSGEASGEVSGAVLGASDSYWANASAGTANSARTSEGRRMGRGWTRVTSSSGTAGGRAATSQSDRAFGAASGVLRRTSGCATG